MRLRLDTVKLAVRAGLRDKRGATAVLFALSFAVMAPMALGMFDAYTATEQRGKLQDALDAATLYAARSPAQTDAEIDAIGDKALAANLNLMEGAVLQSSSFQLSGSKVVSVAQAQLPAFSPAWPHDPIAVNSEVQRSMDKLEIALVLDNTGSMAGTKLTTLKAQAKILVDKLQAASLRSADPTPIKISLVPFSSMVRVQGNTSLTAYNTTSHSGTGVPTWIDPQAKWRTDSNYDIFSGLNTDRLSLMKGMNVQWAGCVESRPQPYDVLEDTPVTATPGTKFVPYFWPDELGAKNSSGQVNDYVNDTTGSTTKAKLQAVGKYATTSLRSGTFMTGYSYGPNAGCGLQPIIRLTTDTAAIKTGIDAMTAVGETNIPQGLAWGWHVLSPIGPLADGSPYTTLHLKKVVILMTDGQNTFMNSGGANSSFYHGLGYIWQRMLSSLTETSTDAQRTTAMDARLSQLCTNMKAKKIDIYTIRVEVSSGTSALLQGCATTPDKFFDVTNVANLGAAFDAIAGAITNLRISH